MFLALASFWHCKHWIILRSKCLPQYLWYGPFSSDPPFLLPVVVILSSATLKQFHFRSFGCLLPRCFADRLWLFSDLFFLWQITSQPVFCSSPVSPLCIWNQLKHFHYISQLRLFWAFCSHCDQFTLKWTNRKLSRTKNTHIRTYKTQTKQQTRHMMSSFQTTETQCKQSQKSKKTCRK